MSSWDMEVVLDEGAFRPTRAHPWDAGLDLRTREGFTLAPGESYDVDTGVHMSIPRGYCGHIVSKSGLNVRHGIVSTGMVDAGYTGSVVAKLYNLGTEAYEFAPGDKVTQLVVLPCALPGCVVVEELPETERGDRGFGSTGR